MTLSMTINFGIVAKCNEEFLSIKSPDLLINVVLEGHLNFFSCYITTNTSPMASKLDKVVTYRKKLQSSTH